MFTFIRIAADRILHMALPKAGAYDEERAHANKTGGNPWHDELYRLAERRGRAGGKPNLSRPGVASYLPKPPQKDLADTNGRFRQGTLADLKVWWGKAIATYKPQEVDLKSFAPPSKRRPNHWTS